jgi:hypothetical protein
MFSYTLPIVSFTASAAPPAWCITATPTRFTRAIGDGRRFAPPLFFALAERLELFFAERLRALPFFAPRAVGRFLPVFFAPRADGRRDFLALERLLPFFAERFAPARFPRFDLALVAMSVTSSEGGAGRIRNFRAQARVRLPEGRTLHESRSLRVETTSTASHHQYTNRIATRTRLSASRAAPEAELTCVCNSRARDVAHAACGQPSAESAEATASVEYARARMSFSRPSSQ